MGAEKVCLGLHHDGHAEKRLVTINWRDGVGVPLYACEMLCAVVMLPKVDTRL